MFVQIINRPFVVASVLGAASLLSGCGESDKSSNDGSSTDATSSGATSSSGSSGTTTGSGGTGGECPMGPPNPPDPNLWTGGAGGEGGAGGADRFACFPGIVCFSPAVEVEGVPFIEFAFANVGINGEAEPSAANESGIPTVVISAPEPGTVCMKGDDGAGLNLPLWDGMLRNASDALDKEGFPRLYDGSAELFHASSLGITGLSFTIDHRGGASLIAEASSFPPPCHAIAFSEADQNGNPLILSESGTTTLSFEDDFWPTLDTNEMGGLRFTPNAGEYDFCVSDLKFLDEDGDEVVP